ncbi:LytR/AlgR family response regulator transcription factor [Chitinophaga eiseniae]|uniref:Response regulator transcription factor n=1 Tax=Chitinophaga eiseniae TaxID=634771 RepID=A0A847SBX9_9BACT|nr:LytTR family DNA-binding domain-containing protein [Chitinophaga eiseniae]NLR77243.1 response regulator transcription factor [Chitinophaga eiseniae]
MIKALIIEDEEHNQHNLRQLLSKYCSQVQVVGMAADATEARQLIATLQPKLLFLDVQLSGTNAFTLLQELGSYDFEVIFVTAFSEYGIKAIRFSAIDYLMKPLDIQELVNAVNKAVERITQKQENLHLRNLLHYLQHAQNKQEHRIAISSLKEMRLVAVQDILRCQSENSYTFFYLSNGEKILSTIPISDYEELLLNYGFIRCHQSHLVNRKYVRSLLRNDGYMLQMTDNTTVPVSRQKKDMVKEALLRN